MKYSIFYNNDKKKIQTQDIKSYINKLFSLSNKNKVETINKTTKNIISLFYNQIQEIEIILNDDVSYNRELNRIDKTYLKNIDLLNSNYISPIIKNDIIENFTIELIYNIELIERNIHIHFIVKDENELGLYNFDRIIHNINMIILFLSLYQSKELNCSNELNIYIILTDKNKSIPFNDTNNTILTPNYINNAITTSCSLNGEIVIYRKEELFKVLIHELFHNLGLDFSIINIEKIKKSLREIFHLESNYLLYESYCEFWGVFLHTFFYTFLKRHENKKIINKKSNHKREKDIQLFRQEFEFYLKDEILFSIFQSVKILHTQNLTYDIIISNKREYIQERNHRFKEKTNAFSYYILKSIYFFYYNDFVTLCLNYNDSLLSTAKNINVLMNMIKFIERKKSSNRLIELYKSMTELYKSIEQRENDIFDPFYKTLKNSYYSISLH